jgi:hypothetical protein
VIPDRQDQQVCKEKQDRQAYKEKQGHKAKDKLDQQESLDLKEFKVLQVRLDLKVWVKQDLKEKQGQ